MTGQLEPLDGMVKRHNHLRIGVYHQHLVSASNNPSCGRPGACYSCDLTVQLAAAQCMQEQVLAVSGRL
jgi:hypothetical protein